MKNIIRKCCPPILLDIVSGGLKYLRKRRIVNNTADSGSQDLEMYWDDDFAETLESWGKDNTWNEIQMIMSSCRGNVVDIACGTGQTIDLLKKFEKIEYFYHQLQLPSCILGLTTLQVQSKIAN